ncbi:MAG: succinate dehydrogenase, cytochrome b556 subunit [Gammaproteobacteria bacterium]
MRPHRTRALWLAFLLHRLSGIVLALFLPLHFYLLGLALRDAEALDGYLALGRHPLFKFAEFGLVFLLAAHLCGGLRILALEFLPWRDWQKNLAAAAAAIAFAFACAFLLRAF